MMQSAIAEIRKNPDIVALLVLWLVLGFGEQPSQPKVWIEPPHRQVMLQIWNDPLDATLDVIADSIDSHLNGILEFQPPLLTE